MEDLVVVTRLIAAAKYVSDDPSFTIEVLSYGIRLKYVFERDGKFFTIDNETPWGAIRNAVNNPLLFAIDMILDDPKVKHG